MKKHSTIYVLLIAVYVTALLISNILSVKQADIFGLTLPAAIIVFPIVYILSDVFSEVYGYQASRRSRYVAFAMNLLMALAFMAGIALPAAPSFQGQEAMAMTLGSTPRLLVASFAAFLFGDFLNDIVFKKMKDKHQGELKGFKARAILSSVVGEFADSAVFFPIAFLGVVPIPVLISMGVAQSLAKIGYEIIISPVTEQVAKKLTAIEASSK